MIKLFDELSIDKKLTVIVSCFTIGVSIIAAIISYFNYRLNKQLNIKNHIYTEKAKLYREITKKIVVLILFLQDKELSIEAPFVSKNRFVLDELISDIEKRKNDVDHLFLEAWMLMPESALNLMEKFSDFVSNTQPYLTTYTFKDYSNSIEILKQKGENLIKEFRKDLKIENINQNLFK